MDDRLLKTVQTTFSLYGLTITRNLSSSVVTYLKGFDEKDRDSILTNIIEKILSQNLTNSNVEAKSLKTAITEYHRSTKSLLDTETVLNVIDIYSVPQVIYNLEKQKFVLSKVDPDILPKAVYKPLVYKHRFDLLWYRTLQHELFQPLKFGESNSNKRRLSPIETLNSELKTGLVDVMGLLTQLTEGQFYLEDPTGSVKLNLKKTKFHSGLIVEGTIVLANGIYEDGIFEVKSMGLPPPQSTNDSRAIFGDANTFGGPSQSSLKESINLQSHESTNVNAMIIFISNFAVDNALVLKMFKTMLEGYNDLPPVAFVLCGHFLSNPLSVSNIHKLKEGFSQLGDMVTQYPNILAHSKFIFVPGTYDIGAPKVLPRISLPKIIMKDFLSAVPGTILATNPCRIQYCTKEIVVLRENILSKFCRNTLHFPESGEAYLHFAETIISQSHLTPFILPVVPVYWKYDHVLQIYPTPDLIVIADEFKSYSTKYMDCHVINPGSFANNGFSFKAYVPATNEIEDSAIPTEVNE